MQWKAIDENVLANPESARLMAEMFGLDGEAEARREAFHLMYLNTLSMAFVGWKHEAIDQDVYDGHMRYFFSHYKGSTDYVLHLVKLANYPSGFLSECERYLALARTAPLNSSKTASPQPETDAPAEGLGRVKTSDRDDSLESDSPVPAVLAALARGEHSGVVVWQ